MLYKFSNIFVCVFYIYLQSVVHILIGLYDDLSLCFSAKLKEQIEMNNILKIHVYTI